MSARSALKWLGAAGFGLFVAIAGVLTFRSSLPELQIGVAFERCEAARANIETLDAELPANRACEDSSQCGLGNYPFGCKVAVSRGYLPRLNSLANSARENVRESFSPSNCQIPSAYCGPIQGVECVGGQCQAIPYIEKGPTDGS